MVRKVFYQAGAKKSTTCAGFAGTLALKSGRGHRFTWMNTDSLYSSRFAALPRNVPEGCSALTTSASVRLCQKFAALSDPHLGPSPGRSPGASLGEGR